MAQVSFQADEYRADATFQRAAYRLRGSPDGGWEIARNGAPRLVLGAGYRLLRSEQCGVCSTDLVRHLLPFPLPQITGHELTARDERGRRCVVEINASHRARGLEDPCVFCASGLERHCPDRLVLGIHGLPGGFGPWVLAPVQATLEVPEAIPDASAVLVEPFAAAVNAVERLDPAPGDTIAVLGPRRLGLLTVAALRAWRRRSGRSFQIIALSRHRELLDLAARLGADEGEQVEGNGADLARPLADSVIDTTGTPGGAALALQLADREVHLKSTHGRPALGLRHLTEMVVDEITLAPLTRDARSLAPSEGAAAPPRIAWLAETDPPTWLREHVLRYGSAREALACHARVRGGGLPRADAAVVDTCARIDEVIRPLPEQEISLVRPRGEILLCRGRTRAADSPLGEAVGRRGLRISTSRCGDFRVALSLMAEDPDLRGIGGALVTHHFSGHQLGQAFRVTRLPHCLKAVIRHSGPS